MLSLLCYVYRIYRRSIMKVFKAIGNFFARIWRWIKETAWVQPLLIVSLIFGIILLIQPISQGVTALADLITNNEKYFNDNKVKLASGAARNLIYDKEARFKDGDKYFLVFIKKDCPNCRDAYQAFKTLFDDKTFDSDYKIKTISVDEQSSSYELTDPESEMYKIFFGDTVTDNVDPIEFRDAIFSVGTAASHEYNIENYESDESSFSEIREGEDLYTPLILLMDKEYTDNSFNIREALIGIKGSTKYDKARNLDDCWNGTGDFERK